VLQRRRPLPVTAARLALLIRAATPLVAFALSSYAASAAVVATPAAFGAPARHTPAARWVAFRRSPADGAEVHGDVVFWASKLFAALRGYGSGEVLAFPNAITGCRIGSGASPTPRSMGQ
jgi:hypothetical protein